MIEYIVAAILGLLIGSFLNVLILRLPQGENIAYPPSHCPKCKEPLKWWHNIPLLSWILLQGRCYYCKESISIQYPLIEIASAFIFVVVYAKEGFTLYGLSSAIVFDLLLALSIIDLRYKAVPDSINLLAASLALFSRPNFLQVFQDALLVAGSLAMLRFLVSYYVSKKEQIAIKRFLKERPWLNAYFPKYIIIEAMGEGDIIAGFAMGAILGIKMTLLAIFIAALVALPASLLQKARNNDKELPFIPFLALGTFIVYIAGEQITRIVGV